MDPASYIDPTVLRFLPEVAWWAVAPILVLVAHHWKPAAAAWLAPVAAAWAVWRCFIPTLVLPYALGGFAGLVMTPIAALALAVYLYTAVRAAWETPEIATRTRHALVITTFTLVFVSVGAVAAALRLSSMRPG